MMLGASKRKAGKVPGTSFDTVALPITRQERKSCVRRVLRNEGDGAQTRNHRIDSPDGTREFSEKSADSSSRMSPMCSNVRTPVDKCEALRAIWPTADDEDIDVILQLGERLTRRP
jgi:hypothetical protein